MKILILWQTELSNTNNNVEHVTNCTNMIECRSWPPIIAGVLVGYVVVMGQRLRIMAQSLNNCYI